MHPGQKYKGDQHPRKGNFNRGEGVTSANSDSQPAAETYGTRGNGREARLQSRFFGGRGRGRGRGGNYPEQRSEPIGSQQASTQQHASGSPQANVDKNDVSTWRRKDFHELVKGFVENRSSNELSFPSSLTPAQRNVVHRIAMTFNLDHRSSGEGVNRVLKLTKIGGAIDAINRQRDAAEGGVRIKTIDGYQGAQELVHSHLSSEDIDSLTFDLKPHKNSMTSEIKLVANHPFSEAKRFRVHQPGLSSVPRPTHHINRVELQQFRKSLPAYRHGPEIINAVKTNDVVVISGDTGCGKTTQIPQMLFDAGIFNKKDDIICTQPRRISALSVAQRVATERGEACGDSCGYIIRFENMTSPHSRIIYQTTGILLRRLHTEPELKGVACIIVDEVHERDVETDFCLLLLRDRLQAQREHPERFPLKLKLIVMSATVQIEALVSYFTGHNGGRDIPLITIPGTLFPVKEFFLEDVLHVVGAPASAAPAMRLIAEQKQPKVPTEVKEGNAALYEQLKSSVFDTFDRDVEALVPYDLVCDLIKKIHDHSHSRSESILVFLPGWAAISTIAGLLKRSTIARELSILMLHSSLTTAEQQRVFERPPRQYRKVVLATSIAETSITIDDIVYVIDSGLVKGTSYDPEGNTSALKATLIGKANGVQRRGRAGRCQAGVCYHLLPKAAYDALPDFLPPEIVRSPLEEVCLQLKAIEANEKCARVLARAMSAPSQEAIEHAVQFLTDMGAFTADDEKMTNLGKALAELPTHPLLGKMLFTAACFGVLDAVATIAAGLSVKSPFIRPQRPEKNAFKENLLRIDDGGLSDHFSVVKLFTEWIRSGRSYQYSSSHFADNTTLRSLERTKRQFINLVLHSSFAKGVIAPERHLSRYASNKGLVRLVLLWSLYPRIATIEYRANRDTQNPQVFCWDNKSAVFSANSVLAFYKRRDFGANSFVTYYDRMNLEAVLNLFDATAVTPIDILLCLRQLTVRPLLDVPDLFLSDDESKLAPPAYFDVDSLPDKENYSAMFFDGDKKLYIAPKKLAAVLHTARDCLDFFLATCIKNVRSSKFPDSLVRALAQIVGYPISGVDAPVSVDNNATEAVHMDPAIQQMQLAGSFLPGFARREGRSPDDSSASDADAPLLEEEEDGDNALRQLTEAQKANVTAAYGDLAVFRYDGAAELLQAAKTAEETAVPGKGEADEEDAGGDDDGGAEKETAVKTVVAEKGAREKGEEDEQDEEEEAGEEESDEDEDIIVGNLNPQVIQPLVTHS
ncbi:putative Atp-dependent DEAD/H RNA helicase [Leptomonas pyrrhocoris]|uniref:RNA helicase n=1 Tax=Leptomonas pyrrhocoris TaxID=157538 RepID=A0A0N0DZY2_LEPPY|nr:putative Atp-dependent DEAD/H RNA helicase [Leptomonas pyrrhocoris]KPA85805.1 putative Atp-dependent DEAD/H RNA helicase [Leptomonas pyrrhocoris]|eukprot:XP_015664244.1 putative Atp-dependent DEAD/H RNA helicase [Leptomonas pyrrhocoris]